MTPMVMRLRCSAMTGGAFTRYPEDALRSGGLGALPADCRRPLNELAEGGGPFVMNTKAEVRQAYDDYASRVVLELMQPGGFFNAAGFRIP